MIIGKKYIENYKIKIGKHEIEQIKEIKYRWVIFDDKLSLTKASDGTSLYQNFQWFFSIVKT